LLLRAVLAIAFLSACQSDNLSVRYTVLYQYEWTYGNLVFTGISI